MTQTYLDTVPRLRTDWGAVAYTLWGAERIGRWEGLFYLRNLFDSLPLWKRVLLAFNLLKLELPYPRVTGEELKFLETEPSVNEIYERQLSISFRKGFCRTIDHFINYL